MMILIKNGRVLDPATKTDKMADVLIDGGKIAKIGDKIKAVADEVIDASGCYVMPGFIDLHVHLRDPGFEYKETVETGSKAAARGGFTTILAMPNTKPVVDNPDVVRYVTNKAQDVGLTNVIQAGAVTKGQRGEELSEIEEMVEAGVLALSEDGKTVMDTGLYREAMMLAIKYDIPIMAHCEDATLVRGGVMNEDDNAKRLGMPGITNAVEDIIIARDLLLAKETGVRLHLCHCSTKDGAAMLKAAKEQGLSVTGEVCPHHFTLTSSDIPGDDSNYKMNPPLRTREDVDALIQALSEGTLDVIATDHAPHSFDEKDVSMRRAPFGIVGLETAAALTMTELVDKGHLTPLQMAEKMSYNPAKILGIDRGSLEPGKIADVVIFDPKEAYQIDVARFSSRSKNTPFHGKKVKGCVKATILEGRVVYER